MKKTIFAVTLCSIISWASMQAIAQEETTANNPVQGFVIKGTVKNVKNAKLYLSYAENGKQIKDSTIIQEGKFIFKGKVAEPVFSYLNTSDQSISTPIFLENVPITVRIESARINTVTGSKTDVIYKEWEVRWELISQKAGGIYQRLNEAYRKEGKNPDDRNAKLSDVAQKKIDDELAALTVELDSTIFPAIRQHPNSAASAFIIVSNYVDFNAPEKARKAYDLLSNAIKNSAYGRQIKVFLDINEKTAVGSMAADFTMNDITGKSFMLSSLSGKYVLVDFWASWCAPCRKENPNVVKAYAKYHDKGLEIVGVSLDNNKEAWEKAVKDDNLTWIHVSDLKGFKNAAAILYGVRSVPTNFLIDKTGKIIAGSLRGEDLEKKLEEILK